MQFAHPACAHNAVALSSSAPFLGSRSPTDVTPEEVRMMMTYLRKARDRAIQIRERSPAGSYMENVLCRTIDGITLELSQLDYLLARKPIDPVNTGTASNRMRPAI
ncbi:MAG: hypothetical protein K5905_28965 [Roseibium sp.]|uniref:hypothetical protein n=1 Tax=Roseibium sp. TaxID=1936156 RepID=UPI0026054995|nr:hypothetical protein [Roseibium sp.]MCV0429493.1 hypothetical protein [Roseibium sp.]